MPSALWTFYDAELRTAIRAADATRDVARLTLLLAQALRFEDLAALVDDGARLAGVRRDNARLRRRVLALTVASLAPARSARDR